LIKLIFIFYALIFSSICYSDSDSSYVISKVNEIYPDSVVELKFGDINAELGKTRVYIYLAKKVAL